MEHLQNCDTTKILQKIPLQYGGSTKMRQIGHLQNMESIKIKIWIQLQNERTTYIQQTVME